MHIAVFAPLRRIVFSLALASALPFNGSAAIPVKVFLLAGQSNMVGYASISGLAADLLQQRNDILIYAGGQISTTMADKWGTLGPNYGYTIGYFGPELTFGRTMADAMPSSRIALIKYAAGGTDLATQWRGTTGIYYLNFINTVTAALAALDAHYIPEIAGMLWMQGENDARNITMAEEYRKNLTNFIGDVRREFNAPSMPFVIGMIDIQKAWTYNEIVRNAEIAVSHEVPHTGIFDTRGCATNGVHYTRDGMTLLGRMFGQTLLSNTPNSAPYVRAGENQLLLLSCFPLVTYLTGSAGDDGLPCNTFNVKWSKISGPGTTVFRDSTRPVTAVTLPGAGTYTFRLSASDGAVLATALTTISIFPSHNLGPAAACSASYCSPDKKLSALNDGYAPSSSSDATRPVYGNFPQTGVQWVQYAWPKPVSTNMIDVYWFAGSRAGIGAPTGCTLKYWDGTGFLPVNGANGYGTALNRYNTTTFVPVTTEKLRLEFTADSALSTGIIEWKAYEISLLSTHGEKPERSKNPSVLSLTGKQSTGGLTLYYSVPRLAQAVPLELRLFDSRGQRIATLAKGTAWGGNYSVFWNTDGRSCAEGIYIACLTAGESTKAVQICLMR